MCYQPTYHHLPIVVATGQTQTSSHPQGIIWGLNWAPPRREAPQPLHFALVCHLSSNYMTYAADKGNFFQLLPIICFLWPWRRPRMRVQWDTAGAAAAKSLQSCPTLCNPIDLPGSPVPGILQARTLEWVAISFSTAWKWKVKVKSLSRVQLFLTPWTAAHQAPPSMGFFRQEYWSGVPLPSLPMGYTGSQIQ